MKKIITLFIMIVLFTSSLFAVEGLGFGIQAGVPTGVVVDYNNSSNINFKGGLGWNFFTKTINLSASAKYKFDLIGTNSTGTRKMYLSTGPDLTVHFVNDFGLSVYWLGELSYYFPISGKQFSAFVYAGPGIKFVTNESAKFDWKASAGILFHMPK